MPGKRIQQQRAYQPLNLKEAVRARNSIVTLSIASSDKALRAGTPKPRKGSRAASGLDVYTVQNENFALIRYSFLGCFQPDGVQEVIEGLHDRGISAIEGSDLFFRDGLVRSKGLQNGGS